MLTIPELKEKLIQQFDEVTLLDLLEISSEDLVNAFVEKIEDKYDALCIELE